MKKLISLIPMIVLGSLITSVAAGAGVVKPIVVSPSFEGSRRGRTRRR